MAQLLVRGLSDEVKEALRRQAADHGRSMEAEARAILTEAVAPRRPGLVAALLELGQEFGGIELDIPARTELVRPIDFDR